VVGVAAAILAGAIAVVIAAPWNDEEPAAATTQDEFFGVSPQSQMEGEDFAQLAEAGAGTARILFDWGAIQRRAGQCQADRPTGVCDWRGMDDLLGDAAAHGIRVMATMGGLRSFRQDDDDLLSETPEGHPPIAGEDFDAWKGFLAAAAARYGRGGEFWDEFREYARSDGLPIQTWQIWNEPNAERYWPPSPDASEYATLVAGSSEAIRGADPKAEIVLGGLFGTSAVKSNEYLEELYEVRGIEDAFDSLAIHPYSSDLDGIRVQAEWAREAAVDAGDPDVGLWVTELGWGSADDGHPLQQGEEEQARLLRSSLELLSREREDWKVRGIIWFAWKDSQAEGVCEFCRSAGLFSVDGEPKPAWYSFIEAVRE
jgi:polysaccharide biosynthesis protein PslG